MKANRLIEIIFILTERKRVTAKELADRFNVSPRTIYRDIDALSSANIPVYTEKGSGGGIFILPNYIFNKAVLSEDEQNNILMGLQSLKAAGFPNSEAVIKKISSIFNKDNYDWIEVDFSSWGNASKQDKKFNTLKEALIEKKLVSFEYFNSSGIKSKKKVEPVKLIFKYSSWYLQAYCAEKEDLRIYKITRMINVEKLREPFEVFHEPAPLKLFWPDNPAKLVEAELIFKGELAYSVYDNFSPDNIKFLDDGRILVKEVVPSEEWFYNMLLSYGDNVEVVGNSEVLKEFLKRLKSIQEKYNLKIDEVP
ncbi:MAG: YafY family transcriptional regulator [Lachnospiraceae bacterium]|nr:YafY family transcriptional regulator [Lachnospiraceae bacterium]